MSELIKKQFVRTRQGLSKALEGVSPEVFEVIPEGFNNNIHWQVGHILFTGQLFMFKGQEYLPANYREWFGTGSKPANWTGDVPSVQSLLEQLNDQLVRMNDIPLDEIANEKLPEPFIGNETFGELAAMGAFHESVHLGQIQAMKRLIEAGQAQAK